MGERLDTADLPKFRDLLLSWFQTFQRELPWRKNRDPYRIWISEVMLQQTRVAAVIPYYERFLARFPDVESLASAPQEEVLRLWSGLGYYSRARNLQHAAQQIVARHQGKFPRQREELLALAGIGEYTAAAILSIAFDEKHAVLDGNVARVVSRLEAIRGDLREPKRWNKLQASADRLLARESSGDWNQAMMELGATLCTPRSPQCLLCPVAQFCEGRKLGIAGSLPEKPYTKAELQAYLQHCRQKCQATIAALTDEKASQWCKFPWVELSFAELQLYNMRHVQEHASQLSLFLGQKVGSAPDWVTQAESRAA